MGDIVKALVQQLMMQRQKYSKTMVYIAIVAGAAYVASEGVNLSLVIGG